MGIWTTIDDPQLQEAKKNVIPEEKVCSACQKAFQTSAETLSAVNPALAMIMHKCPACGNEMWQVNLPGGSTAR